MHPGAFAAGADEAELAERSQLAGNIEFRLFQYIGHFTDTMFLAICKK